MAKLVLNDVATFVNDASAVSLVNNNSAAIEAAMENTLSRDGASPNNMTADFDMNSNDILNVGNIDVEDITVAGVSLMTNVDAAAASAAAASASASSAAGDATSAAASAAAAATFNPINYVAYAIDTTEGIAAFHVPTAVDAVTTLGYHSAGDSGGAIWRRISTPSPVQLWHIQSADGAWWQLSPNGQITPWQLGAKGDGATDDAAAIQGAVTYGELLGGVRVFLPAANYGIGSTILLGASGPGAFVGAGLYCAGLIKLADCIAVVVDQWNPTDPTLRNLPYVVDGFFIKGRGTDNPSGNSALGENTPGLLMRTSVIGSIYIHYCGSENYTGYADPTTKCFAAGMINNGDGNYKGIYQTDLTVIAQRNYGDGVFLGSETAGVQGVNGNRVTVSQSFANTGYGLNSQAGYGNTFSLLEVQGTYQKGVLRLNTGNNEVYIGYVEGDEQSRVTFDTNAHNNSVSITFSGSKATADVWNATESSNRLTELAPRQVYIGGIQRTSEGYSYLLTGWNAAAGAGLNTVRSTVGANRNRYGRLHGEASANGPMDITGKSRSTAIDAYAAAIAGDALYRLYVAGDDGTQFVRAAEMIYEVDGAVSTGIVPGRVTWLTAGADGVARTGLRQDSKRNIETTTHAALATTVTDGFLYIPTMAGAPTGIPTTKTGGTPIVFDTTNNKLWAYNSGWKGVVLS